MRVSIESKGVLQGITLLDATSKQAKCHRFSHVPYALPPIANRRWRKPEPLPASFSYGSESHPGQFTRPSSMCPQLSRTKRAREIYSEDCLQLNIWVPIGQPPPEGWPVLFYIRKGILGLDFLE
jgi:carboxylesterase type B